jgi:hypothetical protein
MEAIKTSDWLKFDAIGTVKLKGFDEPRALCRAQIDFDD